MGEVDEVMRLVTCGAAAGLSCGCNLCSCLIESLNDSGCPASASKNPAIFHNNADRSDLQWWMDVKLHQGVIFFD